MAVSPVTRLQHSHTSLAHSPAAAKSRALPSCTNSCSLLGRAESSSEPSLLMRSNPRSWFLPLFPPLCKSPNPVRDAEHPLCKALHIQRDAAALTSPQEAAKFQGINTATQCSLVTDTSCTSRKQKFFMDTICDAPNSALQRFSLSWGGQWHWGDRNLLQDKLNQGIYWNLRAELWFFTFNKVTVLSLEALTQMLNMLLTLKIHICIKYLSICWFHAINLERMLWARSELWLRFQVSFKVTKIHPVTQHSAKHFVLFNTPQETWGA